MCRDGGGEQDRRRDILSFMSITKRVFKGVEIFDQRGTYWYDKYDERRRGGDRGGVKERRVFDRKKSVHLGLS
ncbi:hypothetical protein Tco_1018787 [Tanacetum coccineum]|uniref:Uncharacterized protein n=1 Tax=Tanacetum coccineum TaxID=301880 RepID=A0ABQ5FVB3_9ASTR